MAEAVLSWLFAIPLLGFITGLRPMIPMAVLCWFSYTGNLPLDDTWAAWTGKLSTTIIFTVLAVVEIVTDKVPKNPNRINPVPLAGRLVFGGLIGAIGAAALNGAGLEGGLLGALGALTGAFCGYHLRKEIVDRTQFEDWQIAVVEDALAIALAMFALGIVNG